MHIVRIALEILFMLPVAVWLGSLVMMGVASRVIQTELSGRRTEAGHVVGRLRAIFRRIEGVLVLAAWAAAIAHVAMIQLAGSAYGASWRTATGAQLAVLLIATVLAGVISLWLLPGVRGLEAQIGSYSDKEEQIKVRKKASLLHRWIELLNLGEAAAVAVTLAAAVVAIA